MWVLAVLQAFSNAYSVYALFIKKIAVILFRLKTYSMLKSEVPRSRCLTFDINSRQINEILPLKVVQVKLECERGRNAKWCFTKSSIKERSVNIILYSLFESYSGLYIYIFYSKWCKGLNISISKINISQFGRSISFLCRFPHSTRG